MFAAGSSGSRRWDAGVSQAAVTMGTSGHSAHSWDLSDCLMAISGELVLVE